MNQLTDTERNSMNRKEMIQTIDALCSYVTRSLKKTYKRVKAGEQDHIMNLATERGNYVLDYAHRLKANLDALQSQQPAAVVPAGYVPVSALIDAREQVESWGAYAAPYFQDKWDLAGTLAKMDAQIAAAIRAMGEP